MTLDLSSCLPSNRRKFLQDGSLLLLGGSLTTVNANALHASDVKPLVRLGLVTDLHYADKPPAGSRHYRETLAKFEEVSREFEKAKPAAIIELGDLIDAGDSIDAEKRYLDRIQKEFAALPGDKHYVLGNHCVSTLRKEEFLAAIGQMHPHYSFDLSGYHFVVLDACFRSDGQPYGRNNFHWTDANIPSEQVEWLQADLEATPYKTIVFTHQRLDVENAYGVKDAAKIREILEGTGKVVAVIQGHSHKNDLKMINSIHYCTLAALVEGTGVENNSFALLDVLESGNLRISGFRKQSSYLWRT